MSNTNENNTIPPTALVPKASTKLSAGAAAAQMDPEVLAANAAEKLLALQQLSEDATLAAPTRDAVRNLAALASPNKPGMEEMIAMWKVPRIMIAQPTSQSEAKPEAAKNGDLYTSAGQLLERPFGIIPIYFFEENVNFPKNEKNPACSAPDAKLGSPFGECAKCPHLPMGKQNGGRGEQQRTDCSNNIVCVALAQDLSQVYLIQFSKTSRKTGNALLQLAGQQSFVWKQSYLLNSEKKTADVGVYFVYKIEPTGKDNSADVQKVAHALYDLYVAQRKMFLADWYSRPARAPMAAAEAEGAFTGGALDAGLGDESGSEPDLSTPPPANAKNVTQPAGGKSARTSNKPM